MVNNISSRTLLNAIPAAAESYGYDAVTIPDPHSPTPSKVHWLSPTSEDARTNRQLLLLECEAVLNLIFKQMLSNTSTTPFFGTEGFDIHVPTELVFHKVDLMEALTAQYPSGVIMGDVHNYSVGEFEMTGVGHFVEIVELATDDTYDETPFKAVFDVLQAAGIHLEQDELKRGYSSASGSFILLPRTAMVPRRVGDVPVDERSATKYFSTDQPLPQSWAE